MNVKNQVPNEKKKGVVYHIPCKDCSYVYIGETGRTLQKHMYEHKGAVKRHNSTNGVAMHVWSTDHCIDWEAAKVRAIAPFYRTIEAILIDQQTLTLIVVCSLVIAPSLVT